MRLNSRYLASLLLVAASVGFAGAQAPTSNVFFYSGNPDTDPEAYPLVGRLVPGYVRGIAVPYNGGQVTVARDTTSAATGFAPQSNLVVEQVAPPGVFVSINQVAADRAVSFFGAPGVYDFTGALATPNPGTYLTPQRVRFQTPDALTTVQYAINGGGFQDWDSSAITVVQTTTVAYRGVRGGDTGPTKTVVYTIDSLPCSDVDGDAIPDRIEVVVGTDPFIAQGDANGNNINDLDELLRGAPTILPMSVAPQFADTDGDNWSTLDETLRATAAGDVNSFPAAPSLDVVELTVGGAVAPTSAGVMPPGAPVPLKPYPASYAVEVLTPGGLAMSSPVQTAANFGIRTSGEQFHLIRAKALDGSGRQLLAAIAPRGLCIDAAAFCNQSTTLATWRTAYRLQYDAAILRAINGKAVDPRSTAAAFLLNHYYEREMGESYLPGVENEGPPPEVVLSLRAKRNEALLLTAIEAAVTPEMIAVVTDYFRFATSPGEISMNRQIASVFSGEAIDPLKIPAGVRITNFPFVAAQVDAFFATLAPAETVLSGTIIAAPSGFRLTANGTTYRLTGLADTFADNSSVVLRAVVNVDNCSESSPRAQVVGIVSRAPGAVPPFVDSDGDGLDDDWEIFNFGNQNEGANDDSDGDGLPNIEEQDNGTNPSQTDPPIVAGYQGDADLSLFVNAADLVFVQSNLGADYTCVECRGRGDANGNGLVTSADLDTVGLKLFSEYVGAPGCLLVEVPCNLGEFGKSLVGEDLSDAKGDTISLSIQNFPSNVVLNQEFSVNLVIETGPNAIRAAGTRLTFPPDILQVAGGQVNPLIFNQATVMNPFTGGVDLAGLSDTDRPGTLAFATIQLRAIGLGQAMLGVSGDARITNIVRGNGATVDGLSGLGGTVTVANTNATMWMLH